MINLLNDTVSLMTLRSRSQKALISFNEIIDDLKKVNEQSTFKQNKLKEEQALIQKQLSELEDINSSNLKVIGNIEKILR